MADKDTRKPSLEDWQRRDNIKEGGGDRPARETKAPPPKPKS